MIKKGKETFSGFNKPKRTPSHPTKSHAVLAKVGDVDDGASRDGRAGLVADLDFKVAGVRRATEEASLDEGRRGDGGVVIAEGGGRGGGVAGEGRVVEAGEGDGLDAGVGERDGRVAVLSEARRRASVVSETDARRAEVNLASSVRRARLPIANPDESTAASKLRVGLASVKNGSDSSGHCSAQPRIAVSSSVIA